MTISIWRFENQELCFTANTAGSTIALNKTGSPTAVTLETSTDGINWNTYTIGNTITLSNVGDKVYWRNTSTTDTRFSGANNNIYKFSMGESINASGDITYLLNKNGTKTISGSYCFSELFSGCTSLKTAPKLPATTLTEGCYSGMFSKCTNLTNCSELPADTTASASCYLNMFYNCKNLETLPKLPATFLRETCYYSMFDGCSKIKLSTTQTGEYQTAYRIPTIGTATTSGSNQTNYMFDRTGGTFTGTPSINTTYYTSNEVV